jgi:hypothetical protein
MAFAIGLFFVAVALAMLFDSTKAFGVAIPAGTALGLRAVLMLRNHRGVLDRLAEIERAGMGGRTGLHRETVFGGVMLLIVGVGWVAIGVVALL